MMLDFCAMRGIIEVLRRAGDGVFVSSPETRKPNIVGIAPAITGRNPALFVSATISKVIAGVRV